MRYPTQAWYYLGIIAVTGICSEAIIRTTVRTRILIPLFAVGVLALATGGGRVWAAMHEPQTNLDVVAARLETEAGPDDVVVTCPWYLGVTLSRYYDGAATVLTVPPIGDYSISRYDLLKQQMLEPDAMAPLRVAVDRALSSGHRVWIVGGFIQPAGGTSIPEPLPPPPLPVSGWNSFPYEAAWSSQLAEQLRSHAGKCNTLDLGVRGGALENANLIVCGGWKRGI